MLDLSDSDTIEQLVAGDSRVLTALDRLGIEWCANGRTPLTWTCARVGLDPGTTRRLLLALQRREDVEPSAAPKHLARHELADFLERIDHVHVRGQLSRLDATVCHAAAGFGSEVPELRHLDRLFAELAQALDEHIRREEQEVFPALRRSDETDRSRLDRGRLRDLADALTKEHDAHQQHLKMMGRLIDAAQRRGLTRACLEPLRQQVQSLLESLERHGRIEADRIYRVFGSGV